MHKGRNVMRVGHEIELIGSEATLTRLNGMDGIATLRRRGMIEAIEIGETWFDLNTNGAAYVRDRSGEKYTPGWIRRTAARAERRGIPVGKPLKPARDHDERVLALFYGAAVVHVRQVVAKVSQAPLIVSTYGFSSPVSPAVLPVVPDSVDEDFDAA
ncbi:hypothetical protein [Paracoccus jeotgali]|uniref:hypothetical protein n=1 Tax=Paracoccus jeotgali TaxID=2065379 RepID=UPI0028A6CAC3|nr:hypothetical protein [Paracoccus jeotgali]